MQIESLESKRFESSRFNGQNGDGGWATKNRVEGRGEEGKTVALRKRVGRGEISRGFLRPLLPFLPSTSVQVRRTSAQSMTS